MKKIFIFLLAFVALQLHAQDLEQYKQIIKELSSEKYQGRGYAKGGANLAGKYLYKEFEKTGVNTVVCQPFTLDINTFAGEMKLWADGWGPNEYQPLGDLADFEYTDRLRQITQPCLICSGTRDICTPVVAASLYENIPNSRWEVFKGARHTCFVEQTDKYCEILEKWLEECD